jgi:hypothetical protein
MDAEIARRYGLKVRPQLLRPDTVATRRHGVQRKRRKLDTVSNLLSVDLPYAP